MGTLRRRYEEQLSRLVSSTPWLLELLEMVKEVGPPDAYVAAGAVRNAVWDSLHERFPHKPATDVDVVYFDRAVGTVDWEVRLAARSNEYEWDVTNQATVHMWQSAQYGRAVQPYTCLEAALETWPETATAVGVRLGCQGNTEVIAPFGLVDLFELRVRPSPGLLAPDAYPKRVNDKRWQTRWPNLCVLGQEKDGGRTRIAPRPPQAR